MKKTKLLKISKGMVLLQFFIILLFPIIFESLLGNDFSALSSLDYWMFIAPIFILAFIIKHMIQKTQNTIFIILALIAEGYVLLVLSLIVVVLGEIANDLLVMGSLFLLLFIPLFIAFFCDLIALFMPKD